MRLRPHFNHSAFEEVISYMAKRKASRKKAAKKKGTKKKKAARKKK